jgi:hypothetical protein
VVLREARGYMMPHEMVLRIAVQQQNRRARPFDGTVDGDALDVDALVLEARKPYR